MSSRYEDPERCLISDFTSGPVLKQLVFFAAPLFLSNVMQIFYNIADMAVVGRVEGQVGLSAVSVGGDITMCLTTVTMGFATAGQVIIARLLGAKQTKKVGAFIGTLTVFFTLYALCLSVACLAGRGWLLAWMSTPGEVWEDAMAYVTVSLGGLAFICGYNIVGAVLKGLGDARHPFLFVTAATVVNIALDLLFVAGFGWGAAGAAIATVTAQAASFLLAALFLYRSRGHLGFTVEKRDFRISPELLGLLIRLGIPLAVKSAAIQFTKLFTDSFINSYGTVVCAASGVTNKVNSVTNMLPESLNAAGASIVSQNIGAEKYGRVSKLMCCMLMITIPVAAVLSVCMLCWPESIFGFFTYDPEVITVCLRYVPIALLAFASSAVRSPMNALINGCGNYKINFVVAILDGFVLRIGLGLYLGLGVGLQFAGFWLGDAIASFTPCVLGALLLCTGKWKTNRYILNEQEGNAGRR